MHSCCKPSWLTAWRARRRRRATRPYSGSFFVICTSQDDASAGHGGAPAKPVTHCPICIVSASAAATLPDIARLPNKPAQFAPCRGRADAIHIDCLRIPAAQPRASRHRLIVADKRRPRTPSSGPFRPQRLAASSVFQTHTSVVAAKARGPTTSGRGHEFRISVYRGIDRDDGTWPVAGLRHTIQELAALAAAAASPRSGGARWTRGSCQPRSWSNTSSSGS